MSVCFASGALIPPAEARKGAAVRRGGQASSPASAPQAPYTANSGIPALRCPVRTRNEAVTDLTGLLARIERSENRERP
jgi:hypothetical protein